MAVTAAAAQLAVADPARMRPQMYAMTLTTMSHQGSVILIFASDAASGSATIFLICSVVSLIFMIVVCLVLISDAKLEKIVRKKQKGEKIVYNSMKNKKIHCYIYNILYIVFHFVDA